MKPPEESLKYQNALAARSKSNSKSPIASVENDDDKKKMIIAGLSDPLFASKLEKMDRNANNSNMSQK